MMHDKTNEASQSQRILDAAFRCISTRGYANVSLRDISDEAGVVLSQLNYYYKNKEGLFIEVMKMLAQQYLHDIEDNLKKGKSSDENVAYLIEFFQETLKRKPELFRLLLDLISMALWSTSLRELFNNLFNNVTDLIEKYILASFSCKEKFQNYSSAALSRVILGALLGSSVQITLAQDQEEIIDSLSAIQILFE